MHVSIHNPHPHEVPMYWWSNIAVVESPTTRVLAPATTAFHQGGPNGVQVLDFPHCLGTDASYPTHLRQAMDFFFRVLPGQRPWIASLDAGGCGLVQTSTARLRGRKLFLWGMGAGGRHWQEFLSVPGGEAYVEIQAGLAPTQLQCLPMPAQTEWSWLEAYGLLQADPAVVHGPDWSAACREVEERLARALSAETLDAAYRRSTALAAQLPEELVQHGSGWGALERRRRATMDEPPCFPDALPFPDASLDEEQAPWLALLEDGCFPAGVPTELPGAWMVEPAWRALLETATAEDSHWRAWLHLGVLRHAAGDTNGARQAWEQSLALVPSPWALRNLAVLDSRAGDVAIAADRLLQARALAPGSLPLAIECGSALLASGRARQWLDLLDALPPPSARTGRIRYLAAQAALAVKEFDHVQGILNDIEIPDMQEGEISLTDLWYCLHEERLAAASGQPIDDALRANVRRQFPPPARIDFRMGG